MKKNMRILFGLLIGIFAVLLIVAGSGYLWSFRISGVTVPASDMEIAPAAQVGSVVTAKQVVILPLRGNIEEVEVIPGEGWATSGMPRVSWEKYLWNRKKLLVETDLVPLTSGMTGAGEVKLVFRNIGEHSLIWKIPPFEAEISGDSGTVLQLADAVAVQRGFEYRYLWIGLGFALAIGVVYWIWRRRASRNKMPIPPWKRALDRLEKLRFELRQRRLTPESGFALLTDVVRDYLEERFCLPAARKTTDEFMAYLTDNDPLPEDQRPFLRDFLCTADQVKFAKAPPDMLLLNQAIEHAEKLVYSTGYTEEKKEDENV